MQSSELRALQAPFKTQYREAPEKALQELSATGSVDMQTLTCQLNGGNCNGLMGLHPATGGDGKSACAAEMLLQALIGCAGVTFAAVCTALEIPITQAKLQAVGTLDFRGTLGVSRETPVGFQSIRLRYLIGSDASEESLAKAVELSERYCVVAQTLKAISVEWERIAA